MIAPENQAVNPIDQALKAQANKPAIVQAVDSGLQHMSGISSHPRFDTGMSDPLARPHEPQVFRIGYGEFSGLQPQSWLLQDVVSGKHAEIPLPPGYSYVVETKKDGSQVVQMTLPKDYRLQKYGQMFSAILGDPKRGDKNYDTLWRCIRQYEENNSGKTGATMETFPGTQSFAMPLEKAVVNGKKVDAVCGIPVADLLHYINQHEREFGKLIEPPFVVTTATARPTALAPTNKPTQGEIINKTPIPGEKIPPPTKTQIGKDQKTPTPSLGDLRKTRNAQVETLIAEGNFPDPEDPFNQFVALTLLCGGSYIGLTVVGGLLSGALNKK